MECKTVSCEGQVGIKRGFEKMLVTSPCNHPWESIPFGHRHLGTYSYSSIREDQTKFIAQKTTHRAIELVKTTH